LSRIGPPGIDKLPVLVYIHQMKKPQGSLISYFTRMVGRRGGVNLAQGKPGFNPPPQLLDILKKKTDVFDLHQYAPANGNFELLALLVNEYSSFPPITEDNLLVVQGATEGIFLTFYYLIKILKKPFAALSFDPVYESYSKLSDIFGIPFEYVDFEENLEIDFPRLETVIREKRVGVIFIASPGNPLGKVWTRDEMTQIVRLAQEHDCYIIVDAVYSHIYFKQPPFNPLELKSDRLFYINSFSKMLSITGWRVGYIITGKDHMTQIRAIHDYTGLSAPTLFQAAIVEYLSRFDFGAAYVRELRQKTKASYTYMRRELEALNFAVPPIEGGYFIWTKLPPPYRDAFEFASDLYNKVQVAVVPGENFSETKDDYIRLNMSHELPVIREGAERLRKFLK